MGNIFICTIFLFWFHKSFLTNKATKQYVVVIIYICIYKNFDKFSNSVSLQFSLRVLTSTTLRYAYVNPDISLPLSCIETNMVPLCLSQLNEIIFIFL